MITNTPYVPTISIKQFEDTPLCDLVFETIHLNVPYVMLVNTFRTFFIYIMYLIVDSTQCWY